MPVWLKEKLFLESTLKEELAELAGLETSGLPELMFAEHDQSHAVSAFYFSPFDKAVVLCMDGVGEWATTSARIGEGADHHGHRILYNSDAGRIPFQAVRERSTASRLGRRGGVLSQ